MKKNISRIAALLAAAALVFGAVGCSSDDGDENSSKSGPVVVTGVTVAPETVSLTVGETATVTATVTPSNATDKTVDWSSSDEKIAAVKDGVITAVAAGSATVTVTTTDGKKTATVAVTVTAKDAGGESGGNTPVTPSTGVDYTFDSSTLKSLVGSNPPTKITTSAAGDYYDTAVVLYSKKEGLRIRAADGNGVYAINYNGGEASTAVGSVDSTLGFTPDRYVGVDVSKLSATGNVTVSFTVKAVKSSNATGDDGQIGLVNSDGKVLAVETGLKVKSGDDTRTISATVAKDAKVALVFTRNGAGAGGIDVNAITVKDAE